MTKRARFAIWISLFSLTLLFSSVAVFAAQYQRAHTDDSWPLEKRTAGGVVFTATYNKSNHWDLKATKGGAAYTLSTNHSGGSVLCDGTSVIFTESANKTYSIYQSSADGTNRRLIRSIKNVYGIDLSGVYKSNLFLVVNSPEGYFAKVNLTSGKMTKLVKKYSVTESEQQGKYFILSDGTGAGYSYLGVYNAASGKFKKIASTPISWKSTGKYVYFAASLSGYFMPGSKKNKITVKRVKLSNLKSKTLVRSMKATYVGAITEKYLEYSKTSSYKNMKKKYW